MLIFFLWKMRRTAQHPRPQDFCMSTHFLNPLKCQRLFNRVTIRNTPSKIPKLISSLQENHVGNSLSWTVILAKTLLLKRSVIGTVTALQSDEGYCSECSVFHSQALEASHPEVLPPDLGASSTPQK